MRNPSIYAWVYAACLIGTIGTTLFTAAPANAEESRSRNSRQTLRFDADWRFYLGDIPGSEDGVPVDRWRWKAADRGLESAQEMAAPNLDTSNGDWQDATDQDVFHGRRGWVCYRAVLGAIPGPRRWMHFENVDDNAVLYLNGRRIGAHEGWGQPFDVPLDDAWSENGPNRLAVMVENTDGPGGIMGPALLQSSGFQSKSGGPADPRFNDRSWRAVDLPHDFVVEGHFDPNAETSHGFLPVGVGWYRKTFSLRAQDRGKGLFLDFDGVYRNSTVWLNGHPLGKHASGYIGFRYDITPYVQYGGRNVLVVRVDARQPEGWWYEGGGIYRHVWLVKTDPLHVAQWGTYVSSEVHGIETGESPSADVAIRTTVDNNATKETACRVLSQIVDADGRIVATAQSTETVPAGRSVEVAQQTRIGSARLWSLETPTLYRLRTTLQRDGRTVDSYETPFGLRTIRFDPEKGLLLNGKPVKIQGTCNHQDFAGVGIALPDRIHVYKIERLKSMGSNAYRCSHNPPAPELLDACDRLGMLVMDENRHLGDTYRDHSPPGTPYSDLADLRDMIRRDRNHPGIIMWSMCNEEGLQGSAEGAKIFAAMKEVVRKLDTTRPVTCAMNGGWGRGISRVEDLQGCNYNPGGYDNLHRQFPDQPMYGSETASTVGTRGIYANDAVKGYVSAYDTNAPGWGETAEAAWIPLADRDYMAGGFVWTGFDYRGEPTPYAWPCINSHFGIMDTCGFPKDNYFYYQAWWGGSNKPVLHLFPHWNWAGREGQEIAVWCYGNGDHVELFLNGQSLGAKEMPRNGHVEWSVKYAPGKLEAKEYRDGKEIATDRVETTGTPASLQLAPDRDRILADGEDVVMVAVSVHDAQGRVVPTADNEVHFRVTGDARILGVGNGDPSSHEPDKASQRRAFNGLCMVIVQAGAHPGDIHLIAESPGLTPATVLVHTEKGGAR